MKTKRVTMTGETLRDLYGAVHNPVTNLRLSRLRAQGSLAKDVDTDLTKLELEILNMLEAALGLPLRASPPPNVRVESEPELVGGPGKKRVGRPKKKDS